ncbi:hypothetical protein GHO41_11785 [Pseudomonas sp. FSL R10-0399]|uniref:hypothetical protein n=1 Tax=Pseudomonas sp. FSL R10-0399 TaxID=2662194 RepID=UPI001297033D|nr:hypothetical protein [Pseudomonas sp. FSL R10-0399]MQT58023.1 hypothetical protein [Pseudomonas sp. FSL R10-0399]
MARELSEFEQELVKLVNPLTAARWQADYRWDNLERAMVELGNDYQGLELCPDFQRGHVWQPEQQAHFVENCLRGIVPASGLYLQFNKAWLEFPRTYATIAACKASATRVFGEPQVWETPE